MSERQLTAHLRRLEPASLTDKNFHQSGSWLLKALSRTQRPWQQARILKKLSHLLKAHPRLASSPIWTSQFRRLLRVWREQPSKGGQRALSHLMFALSPYLSLHLKNEVSLWRKIAEEKLKSSDVTVQNYMVGALLLACLPGHWVVGIRRQACSPVESIHSTGFSVYQRASICQVRKRFYRYRLQASKARSKRVRYVATLSLRQSPSLSELFRRGGHKLAEVRESAAIALARRAPGVHAALLEAAKQPQHRAFVAFVLSRLGSSSGALRPEVFRWLKAEANGGIRRDLLLALLRIGPRDKILFRRLQRSLRDRSLWVQVVAVRGLLAYGKRGKRALVPYVRRLLRRSRWQDRQRGVRLLEKLGRLGLPLLKKAIGDSNLRVKSAAMMNAGRLGRWAKPFLPAFVKALRHRSWRVRYPAAEALHAMGRFARPALEPLARAISDSNWGVRAASSMALSKIGPAALPALSRAMRRRRSRTRVVAVQAVSKMRGAFRKRVTWLAKALRDRSRLVRYEAALGLKGFPLRSLRRARYRLLRALGDRDWGIRYEAMGLLARLPFDSRSTRRPVLRMLRSDSHPKVRQQAARFARKVGRGGVGPLLRALQDKHPSVRLAAVKSLQTMSLTSAERRSLMSLYPERASVRSHPDLWVALGAPGWRNTLVMSQLPVLQRFLSSYLVHSGTSHKDLEPRLYSLLLQTNASLSRKRRRIGSHALNLWLKSSRATLTMWERFPHAGVQAWVRWRLCRRKQK